MFAHGGAAPISDPFLVDVGLLSGHPGGRFGEALGTKSSKGSGCETFRRLFGASEAMLENKHPHHLKNRSFWGVGGMPQT